MLHYAGKGVSRFSCVLQIGVPLIKPVSIGQLISGCYIRRDLLPIPQPCQSDVFGIEVVGAADQYAGMLAARSFS